MALCSEGSSWDHAGTVPNMTTVHTTVVIKNHRQPLLEFPPVRKFLLGFAVLSVSVCSADTIHLKNGRSIVADSVREIDGKIEYEIGDNSYRIPKSLVEKVEISPAPVPDPTPRASARPQFPADGGKPVPVAPRSGSAEELRISANDPAIKAVHDGKVDLDVLNQLDAAGNSNSAAAGYFLAGRFEDEQGNREAAARYFERALGYAPDSAVILTHYSVLLIQTGRAREAVNYAEHATQVAPNSADAYAILGYAYFSTDRSRMAVQAWQKSVLKYA